ncbi:hypothetical protein XELAEV_18012201mg [Xenopus laevis]|uniref:Uncharacterized protein n=1 Tax=Xenopus laevis TaxID=8355 RepID=A0A974DM99_XENLA|nr:hypothetical protein XELAEV_18012201mg [Xenopus laevis]
MLACPLMLPSISVSPWSAQSCLFCESQCQQFSHVLLAECLPGLSLQLLHCCSAHPSQRLLTCTSHLFF